ncbi:hypothetical protein JZ751_005494 [Albula glossodonta]|uniref:Uncharacterized protein n=1 Tax=Albula glossodonta TaxID=121402 RepID=A0A8T2NBV4_9TELE|nr:hypothetical protein JZ751_005494 [Albula glossodonta]
MRPLPQSSAVKLLKALLCCLQTQDALRPTPATQDALRQPEDNRLVSEGLGPHLLYKITVQDQGNGRAV